jgi:hypothetical protein
MNEHPPYQLVAREKVHVQHAFTNCVSDVPTRLKRARKFKDRRYKDRTQKSSVLPTRRFSTHRIGDIIRTD